MRKLVLLICASSAMCTAAHAENTAAAVPAKSFSEAEIAAIELPSLAFKPTQADIDAYDKYYYFHRPETDFNTAYADISECDALASGIGVYKGRSEPYPGYYGQYGIGGAIGGAIGNVLADAIFGSSERRKVRRINMRNCMSFKGYARYGLSKDVWKPFNFEEGGGREDEDVRRAALLKQARVASGPLPQQKALEP